MPDAATTFASDNRQMYMRAGLISVMLLLLSRVLGLGRESVQAALFGSTGLADVVVAMLTLPDLLSTALTSGALAYVLLPWWAQQTPEQIGRGQRLMAQWLLILGGVLAVLMWVTATFLAHWLVPASSGDAALALRAAQAVRWAAVAMPLALLSLLWYTRCQHERDPAGMYGMNVVHTAVLIAAMLLVTSRTIDVVVMGLGLGMLVAYALRLVFLAWRLRGTQHTIAIPVAPVELPVAAVSAGSGRSLPAPHLWLWALLAAGLPALLPIMARSMASSQASGALAIFNYAYKLVELPSVMAIQLVATLAFPALTRAYASGLDISSRLQLAWGLSWTLACAAVIALVMGAQPLGMLLFGWGKMTAESLQTVAAWAATGAWTLLPQSVLSVLMLVLAMLGRLRTAALAFGAAILVLLCAGYLSDTNVANFAAADPARGASMMLALSAALWTAVLVAAYSAWDEFKAAFVLKIWLTPLLLCMTSVAVLRQFFGTYWSVFAAQLPVAALALSGLTALCLLGACFWINPILRSVLKR